MELVFNSSMKMHRLLKTKEHLTHGLFAWGRNAYGSSVVEGRWIAKRTVVGGQACEERVLCEL